MVRLDSGRMLYGDVSGQLTHEITKGGLIQYLMSKNLHWDKTILNMIEWKGMETRLDKMKDTEVTNVLKMVHGWQNDGYQKDLFDELNENHLCPAGCGEEEGQLDFVKYKAMALHANKGPINSKRCTMI